MTAYAISLQDFLIGRGGQPLAGGFQHVPDVTGDVPKRTDQLCLRDESANSIRLVDLHQRDVEVPVPNKHVPDGFEVDQWNVVSVSDAVFTHDACPFTRDTARDHQNTSRAGSTQDSWNHSNNRFCDAPCTKSTQLHGVTVAQKVQS